ncbi:MAG: cell division protein FtsZ [Mycoplasma sp.]|nr:cell division protein FtsZ [Mycoplasma sp.]
MNSESIVKIKVIGVGGAGNNTVEKMISKGLDNVKFIVANTDVQQLNNSTVNHKLTLGISTKGLGAGSNPEVGQLAAIESERDIQEIIKESDLIIIAAGMGGGTGTGASPIIANLAKKSGALVVAIVTTPFSFEGRKRRENAESGIKALEKEVDSIVVISNDKLLKQFADISLKDSFNAVDKVLECAIRTITDLLQQNNLINLDFADLSSVVKNKGHAIIGMGKASGEDRAIKAATYAISSPLLETSILGAQDVIINVAASDITLAEAEIAVNAIEQASGNQLNILFGVSIQEELADALQVSVIATGNVNLNNKQDHQQIKNVVSNALEKVDVSLENVKTKEILIDDPFPSDATHEFSYDGDLPLFLKKDGEEDDD